MAIFIYEYVPFFPYMEVELKKHPPPTKPIIVKFNWSPVERKLFM